MIRQFIKLIPKKLRFPLVIIVLAIIYLFQSGYIGPKPDPIEDLTVRFVDVGQADCEIIQLPDGRNIIIDGGKNDTEDTLVEKIRNYGIQKFDYVIATHPHEDHIGGLDKVIENFEIGCVYMPDATSNSKTFDDMLDIIEYKNVQVKQAKAGEYIIDEGNICLVFVAPNSEYYEETNDYSAVARLTYGDCSFLFTGDAEASSEREILRNGMDISADVLKVGHHGSSTSTTREFLYAVNPKYAVIEVGEDNSYGHPHDEIERLLSNIETYRTDLNGNIIMVCDGVDIEIITEKQ